MIKNFCDLCGAEETHENRTTDRDKRPSRLEGEYQRDKSGIVMGLLIITGIGGWDDGWFCRNCILEGLSSFIARYGGAREVNPR